MPDEKVIGFPGYRAPLPAGEPAEAIVTALTEFLEQAKAGQLRAIAIAVVVNDGTSAPIMQNFFDVYGLHASHLEAELNRLVRRYGQWRDED